MHKNLYILDLLICMRQQTPIMYTAGDRGRFHPCKILAIELEDGSGDNWNITIQGPGMPKQTVFHSERHSFITILCKI